MRARTATEVHAFQARVVDDRLYAVWRPRTLAFDGDRARRSERTPPADVPFLLFAHLRPRWPYVRLLTEQLNQ